MKINLETIQKLNPCQDRLDNYKNHYNTSDFTLEEFLNLDKITYTDKVWVVTKLFTKKQNVLWSIKCAESVLHLFEREYPEDKRPRDAIEAARFWTIKQDEVAESARSAESAARSAESAARSAAWSARSTWSAARSAAESAARSAESTARSAARSARSTWSAAESAAWSAARSAMSAAWSAAMSAARSAAESARSAAESARSAAEKQQEELNLKFMLEVYNETKGE